MKFVKKTIGLLLCLVLTVSLFGCGDDKKGDVSAKLSNYTIDAVLNDTDMTLEVEQKIDYCNNYEVELNDIYLHLFPSAYREGARFTPIDPIDESEAYPNGRSYGGITINSLKVNGADAAIEIGGQDEDILIVALPTYLMPTQRVAISLAYSLKIPNVRHRFGYNGTNINLGNFYPIVCMYENGEYCANPYYSNGDPFYSDLANYKVSITTPSKYTVAMTGKPEKTPLNDKNKWSCQADVVRDFAIVVGEFNTLSKSVGGTEVTYYYNNDAEAQSSLDIACASLQSFNDFIGQYPYKSYSVVQTHLLASGMEYPGLVYISNIFTGELYRDVIVHETAHQWWYGVVGNDQVNHAWVDETITEYCATLFYEKNPVYNIKYSDRIADALSSYTLYCDIFEKNLNTKMTRPLNEFSAGVEYTAMVYIKGQIMMDTLRTMIGDTAFFNALKSYYSDNYFKFSKPDNFIAAFEKSSKRDLSGFFNTWTGGNEITFTK